MDLKIKSYITKKNLFFAIILYFFNLFQLFCDEAIFIKIEESNSALLHQPAITGEKNYFLQKKNLIIENTGLKTKQIINSNQKKIWTINLADSTYIESDFNRVYPTYDYFYNILKNSKSILKKEGTSEKIENWKADLVTLVHSTKEIVVKLWFSKEVNFPSSYCFETLELSGQLSVFGNKLGELKKEPGYPVKIEINTIFTYPTTNDDFKLLPKTMTITKVLKEIKKIEISPTLFDKPSGLKLIDIPIANQNNKLNPLPLNNLKSQDKK